MTTYQQRVNPLLIPMALYERSVEVGLISKSDRRFRPYEPLRLKPQPKNSQPSGWYQRFASKVKRK